MSEISFIQVNLPSDESNLVVTFVTPGQLDEPMDLLEGRKPAEYGLSVQGFSAKKGSSIIIGVAGRKSCALVGFKAGEIAPDDVRILGASVSKLAKRAQTVSVIVDPLLSMIDRGSVRYLVEGVILGAYEFGKYKTSAEPEEVHPNSLTVEFCSVSSNPGDFGNEIAVGVAIGNATIRARDLVNEPASFLTPHKFCEIATEFVSDSDHLEIEVWDLERIKSERLGGLLGVAAGSMQEPRVAKITYTPSKGYDKTVALVGKGITFDSGGLNIKSFEGMKTMKTDMGGAAAVLCALAALPVIQPEVRVIGFMMLTENMPSGTATKPGDVLTTRTGKTIEVLNTDAEGRLVLADGLALAAELSPDIIVDIATLTGACVVALGDEIAGVFANDDELVNQLSQAGHASGEELWRLPMPDQYKKHINSEIADIQNIGVPGAAGAIAGAMLLKEFVGQTKWAHLDIAGPSRASSDYGYIAKGATGFGARLFCYYLENIVI